VGRVSLPSCTAEIPQAYRFPEAVRSTGRTTSGSSYLRCGADEWTSGSQVPESGATSTLRSHGDVEVSEARRVDGVTRPRPEDAALFSDAELEAARQRLFPHGLAAAQLSSQIGQGH
jgi:hypothetical protein